MAARDFLKQLQNSEAAPSVLTLLLSSDNLSTGYEQFSQFRIYEQFRFVFHWPKIDSCYIKNSIKKTWQLNYLSKN